MAQESCDLNKDEAEILKPSSSPSPSPSPTTATPPPPTTQIPEPPPQQLAHPTSPPPLPAEIDQFVPEPCGEVTIEASKKRKLADATATDSEALSVVEPLSPVLFVNRCNVCRKRVRLTGFRCRCGNLFCPRHRHSETHNCSFDYKTTGREEIARANPVIRAAKIIKI
jgi:hypothetical protein